MANENQKKMQKSRDLKENRWPITRERHVNKARDWLMVMTYSRSLPLEASFAKTEPERQQLTGLCL